MTPGVNRCSGLRSQRCEMTPGVNGYDGYQMRQYVLQDKTRYDLGQWVWLGDPSQWFRWFKMTRLVGNQWMRCPRSIGTR